MVATFTPIEPAGGEHDVCVTVSGAQNSSGQTMTPVYLFVHDGAGVAGSVSVLDLA